MGGITATNKVVNKLLILLNNTNFGVRRIACDALAEIGENAANDEVIDRLSILFSDTNDEVRRSACDALANMGGTTATNKVVNKLLILLDNTNDGVRSSACDALAKMGGKAATDEMINKLLFLLDDINGKVRNSACDALKKMGEKAATDKVINKLVFLFDDINGKVRNIACVILKRMGERAATNEVMERLLDAYHLEDSSSQYEIRYTIEKMLDLLPSLADLKDESRVQKLSMFIQKMDNPFLKNTSPEKFIRAFLITKIELWLPIIRKVFILHNYAITVTENTIIVYGSRDPIKLTYSEREFGQQLKDCFVNWLGQWLSGHESVVE